MTDFAEVDNEDAITLVVATEFENAVDANALRALARKTLASEQHADGELTIVITDNETVRDLNRAYRALDEPTDVLSFPTEPAETDPAGFVTAPDAQNYLGDVVIAYPYAAAQASALGRAVADELALLTVHGILHLLGYDHATPDEEAVMWAKQAALLTPNS